ncbi:MAG: beta-ketoacyl-[acyl-carrier-protein] synthase family protein [Magnetococcales bacterium]|nr:beta-ketoacyl-[acyl-carrier-protein] synthase family protein [Magnetococcales bacterium]
MSSRPDAQRVVITGMGALSSLGTTAMENWEAMQAGRCGIRLLETIDPTTLCLPPNASLQIGSLAPLSAIDWAQHFTEAELRQRDPVTRMAVVAAREAWRNAGLSAPLERSHHCGVILGTSAGGAHTQATALQRLLLEGRATIHPLTIPRGMPSAVASHVAAALGAGGVSFVVNSACASATHALGVATGMIRAGMLESAVAGGAEASLTYWELKGWEALRVTSPDWCRPFSTGRQGMVLGEGAAMFVLERLDRARARGAPLWCEIEGFGCTTDRDADLLQPDPEGIAHAMAAALGDAELRKEAIDLIQAHGTGTVWNDRQESLAIHGLFGELTQKIAVSAAKSLLGHTLGASGALELIPAIMALATGILAPTIHHLGPDPECDLNVTPDRAVSRPVRHALKNSIAFGGINAVLLIGAVA